MARVTHTQRVLDLLSDGRPHTHHELYGLGVIAHSRVADLRRRGYNIVCWTAVERGERVSVYQLLGGSVEGAGGSSSPGGGDVASPATSTAAAGLEASTALAAVPSLGEVDASSPAAPPDGLDSPQLSLLEVA